MQKRILWWDFFCVALIQLTCYCHSRLVPSLLLSFVAVVGRSRVTSTAFRRRERRPTGRKESKRARESSPLAPSHHPLRVSLSRTDSRSFSLPSLPNPPPFPPYFPPLPLLTPATQASSPYKKRLENLRVRYFLDTRHFRISNLYFVSLVILPISEPCNKIYMYLLCTLQM